MAAEDVCIYLELHKETLHYLRSRFFEVSEGVYKEYYDLYYGILRAIGLLYALVPQRDDRGAVRATLNEGCRPWGLPLTFACLNKIKLQMLR